MKCIILAGGKGSRISEYTRSIPKPMINIKGLPIIVHIINHYTYYGIKDFIIAGGYKFKTIKNFFNNHKIKDCKITVVNTGLDTLTGKRIKKLESYINEESFCLTYGDGLSNINIKELIKFHNNHKKIMTVSAVHPPARFGEMTLKKNKVKNFQEKPQLVKGWINGGFFVIKKSFFKVLNSRNVMLEREPMQKILKQNQLMAFKHPSFWFCMDTLRDKNVLEKILKKKKKFWLK